MDEMNRDLEQMPEEMEETGSADLLQIYLDEVQSIRDLDEKEEAQLTDRARAGDPAARDRLMEGYLKYALTLLRDHMGGPVSVPEMIGISNLALVKAVRTYLGALQTESLRDMITRIVNNDLAAAEERERGQNKSNMEIAEKANRLTEISKVMANELGRPATEAELAERMCITEDEVRTLVEMTMRAI